MEQSNSPAPNSYDIHEHWNSLNKNKNKKLTSFGASQKLFFKLSKVPGPGAYQPVFNPETHPAYTMRTKTKYSVTHWNVPSLSRRKPDQDSTTHGSPSSPTPSTAMWQ
jgi:hypothetical protein